MNLMEDIVSKANLIEAYNKVISNRGSAGTDGVTTEGFKEQLFREWKGIREKLLSGKYKPGTIRRVEIPKPDGGTRMLGIPTVLDRFIQQAVLQKLTPIFDPEFSEHSYGFRPGRSAHDAVRQAKKYIEEGYEYVVDIDLEKFFDTVNHDILMRLTAEKVQDRRVLHLIGNYLRAGIMTDGVCIPNEEGTPQGGVISPLLANIMLNELDRELESRGHRFCRYADDCNIYVKSRKAGERVKAGMTAFLHKKLKLKVNETKSAVDKPGNRKFLGFSFARRKILQIIISVKSLKRVKDKICILTNSRWSIPMEERIKKLNRYLVGWLGYYSLNDAVSQIKDLDKWLRRRMRLCQWQEWKNPKARIRGLMRLGLKAEEAIRTGCSRKGSWRISSSPLIHKAMGIEYWKNQGLEILVERYETYRESWRTAVYRTVRTVV